MTSFSGLEANYLKTLSGVVGTGEKIQKIKG